jgi:hypothetical protein
MRSCAEAVIFKLDRSAKDVTQKQFRFDFATHSLDAMVEVMPVLSQIL